MELVAQITGCLLGGAIGDAMGGPFEGGEGAEGDDVWRVSDDTQLTLATGEAVVATGGVYPGAIAGRMLAWFTEGRLRGLGASTLKALRDLAEGRHWATAGRGGEMAAGNGAAMRVAPLAFFLDPSAYDDRRTLREVCRITHHHEEAYAGALAVVVALRTVLTPGWDWSVPLTARVAETLPDSLTRDRLRRFAQFSPPLSIAEVARRYGCGGYVVESVPLAMYGVQFLPTLGFTGVLQALIEAGGDTDSNAAMAGQLMGAWLGCARLPADLVARVPMREVIVELGRELGAGGCREGLETPR